MYAIVAADRNWAIGRDGDQLCYIPADLKRFQALTTGHAVVLGRRTLSPFPGGRPLKGRRNLILSRDPAFRPEGAEVFRDLESLLAAAPADAFVIGGGQVYRQLLDRCDTGTTPTAGGEPPGPTLSKNRVWPSECAGHHAVRPGRLFRRLHRLSAGAAG